MKSRTGTHSTFGHATLREAFAAECADKFQEFYLPWIEEALKAVDEETVWRHPREGMNSIGILILHLTGNVRQWIVHGIGGASDIRNRPAEFAAESGPEKTELFARLKQTVDEACEVILSPRSDQEWLAVTRIQGFETTVAGAVFHVVEHFSYHTGQIVLLAKLASGRDLKFYQL